MGYYINVSNVFKCDFIVYKSLIDDSHFALSRKTFFLFGLIKYAQHNLIALSIQHYIECVHSSDIEFNHSQYVYSNNDNFNMMVLISGCCTRYILHQIIQISIDKLIYELCVFYVTQKEKMSLPKGCF